MLKMSTVKIFLVKVINLRMHNFQNPLGEYALYMQQKKIGNMSPKFLELPLEATNCIIGTVSTLLKTSLFLI